jgi:hypothetical protein
MPIKDKAYWKEYNQKRKEKGYFQQNYQTRKGQVVKNGEGVVKSPEVVKSEVVKSEAVVKSLQPNKEVVNNPKSILQPNPVVKNESLQPATILQPAEKSLQPPKCSRCSEIENSISEFANLYRQEQEKTEEQKRINQQLEKEIKESRQPINPTIERWKADYFTLEKKTNQQLSEQSETINRLKEKLREKDKQNQA